jgi:anti-anti-sigma factor
MAEQLRGDLVYATVERLARHLDALDSATQDLSAVTRIDSSGIALLVALARRAHARGERLMLHHVPPQALSLIEFFGVHQIVDCRP